MMDDASVLRQAEKLIGGWVAGTLTGAERSLLLQASLTNQALFDALADEEGLRELLADPAVRRELVAALAGAKSLEAVAVPAVESWWRRLFKPAPMAAFTAGVLAVVSFIVIRPEFFKQAQPPPQQSELKAPVDVATDDKTLAENSAPPPERESKASKPVMTAVVEKKKDAPGPPPPAASAPAERSEMADRLAKAEEPRKETIAMASVPPPPPAPRPAVAAPAPAAPAVAATASTEVRTEAVALSRADEAKNSAKLPPPFRYRIERLQEPGDTWVEFGGELGSGAKARLAIVPAQAGFVSVRLAGGNGLVVAAKPGETIYFPASGNLPTGPGERELAIVFQTASPLGGVLGGAAQPPAQLFRARKQAAQEQMQQIPGGGLRQKQAADAEAPAQAATPANPADYSVTVRLRYR